MNTSLSYSDLKKNTINKLFESQNTSIIVNKFDEGDDESENESTKIKE